MTSIFSNIDYLFWLIPSTLSEFPWIIWCIWKAKNDKIFKNVDKDPRRVLQTADGEAKLWLLAQTDTHEGEPVLQIHVPVTVVGGGAPRCHIDGSWKAKDNFSGLGWFYFQDT